MNVTMSFELSRRGFFKALGVGVAMVALPPSSLSFLEPARAIQEPFYFLGDRDVINAWSRALEHELRQKDPLFEEYGYG